MKSGKNTYLSAENPNYFGHEDNQYRDITYQFFISKSFFFFPSFGQYTKYF